MLGTYCNHCLEEAQQRGEEYNYDFEKYVLVELNEDGIYNYKCPNNHIQWTFIHEHLFQILFDLGVLALSDSYTREAISSFATSLERFYEFIIKLILLSENRSEKLLEKLWKHISLQSERQLGAFISLYASKFNKLPTLPVTKLVKFRNDVMHKGKIPNEVETLEYGQSISDIIFDGLFDLRNYFQNDVCEQIHRVYQYNVKKVEEKHQEIKKAGGSSSPTIIQIRTIKSKDFKRVNVEAEVNKYRNSNKTRRIQYLK